MNGFWGALREPLLMFACLARMLRLIEIQRYPLGNATKIMKTRRNGHTIRGSERWNTQHLLVLPWLCQPPVA